jgi:hypothetical protein
MGTKQNPGDYDCYENAAPDEPMFVLLARDPAAPAIVEKWCEYREGLIKLGAKPASDQSMIDEARNCAADMQRWRNDNRYPIILGKYGK